MKEQKFEWVQMEERREVSNSTEERQWRGG